jgi:hypothetical protein
MEADQETFLQLIDQMGPVSPPITEIELSLFDTDHGRIGYVLAKDWRIPDPIAEAIRDHHLINGQITPKSPTGILQMSEYIIQQLNFPAVKEGLPLSLAPCLASHIQENVEEYKVLAEDLPEELEKTQKMYGG